jgi:imidazolonepropionase-like amidohydrolase
LAKSFGIRTGWGTDLLFDAAAANRQGAMLMRTVRWYALAQVLKLVTADNAELLLVNGDPFVDLTLLEDPAANFVVVVEDGAICRSGCAGAGGSASRTTHPLQRWPARRKNATMTIHADSR